MATTEIDMLLTHSFPTRRSSDLRPSLIVNGSDNGCVFSKLANCITAVIVSIDLSAILVASRTEENTPELQSLMRISYAFFCSKEKNEHKQLMISIASSYRCNTFHRHHIQHMPISHKRLIT